MFKVLLVICLFLCSALSVQFQETIYDPTLTSEQQSVECPGSTCSSTCTGSVPQVDISVKVTGDQALVNVKYSIQVEGAASGSLREEYEGTVSIHSGGSLQDLTSGTGIPCTIPESTAKVLSISVNRKVVDSSGTEKDFLSIKLEMHSFAVFYSGSTCCNYNDFGPGVIEVTDIEGDGLIDSDVFNSLMCSNFSVDQCPEPFCRTCPIDFKGGRTCQRISDLKCPPIHAKCKCIKCSLGNRCAFQNLRCCKSDIWPCAPNKPGWCIGPDALSALQQEFNNQKRSLIDFSWQFSVSNQTSIYWKIVPDFSSEDLPNIEELLEAVQLADISMKEYLVQTLGFSESVPDAGLAMIAPDAQIESNYGLTLLLWSEELVDFDVVDLDDETGSETSETGSETSETGSETSETGSETEPAVTTDGNRILGYLLLAVLMVLTN
eukprot:TRINITY_DN3192_c0_g1_i1.p1 TRINITY_DN3192_c0_g1~~TRINITY_DN3192_c0_g1_i1.p1  ORF type:complete len:435 (-),score=93.83 TRINITY_DN3192_c0_g1_i1:256-1560(-)